jgi:hypothetical protein
MLHVLSLEGWGFSWSLEVIHGSLGRNQCFRSALFSMRIRIQKFKAMRIRIRIQIHVFDDKKFF